jgi:hypothetical protein
VDCRAIHLSRAAGCRRFGGMDNLAAIQKEYFRLTHYLAVRFLDTPNRRI